MADDQYKTLEATSEGMLKEKGSRFLAFAMPVESIDDIKKKLDHFRKQYHDARHHCYAYRIGSEPFELRYQDDGEPSGTAGKPIFGQIQSFGLTNVLIVVIRYFGGVKLGTGGLIQAYRAAAKDAISHGKIISKNWTAQVQIGFKYSQMNDVMRIIKEEKLRVLEQETSDDFVITLEINQGKLTEIENKFKTFEMVEWTII